MSSDPLLQPYQLKHLTLKNRLMITSHEPAYPEDGMPKERYRAYHVERARAGIAMTMTAGSASVARDSPPVFNNLLAWKDEVVGWMQALADECHEHGCAVMIQLTHLGRRTRWDKADWLPVVSAGHEREAAHRAFPKKRRGLGHRPDHRGLCRRRRADAGGRARRHRAPGLRPPDGPVLVAADQRARRALRRQPRQPPALHLRHAQGDPRPGRRRLHRRRPLHRRRGPARRPRPRPTGSRSPAA